MTVQAILFEDPSPPIPGLSYRAELIDVEAETALLEELERLPVSPFRFQGWIGKRETLSFGWHYDFDKAAFAPAEPIPAFLLPLRDAAAAFAQLAPDALVQVLVTRYAPGAGIGWHRDRPVFEDVIGISLGAPATLRFRRREAKGFARHTLPLERRSVYGLTGSARHEWEHNIQPMEQLRWSVTFRTLSAAGKRRG